MGDGLAILHQDDLKKRMNRILGGKDALKKWMTSLFTPHQTTTFSKWLFSQNVFFISSWLVRHSSMSPTSSDDLCHPFCIYPFPWDAVSMPTFFYAAVLLTGRILQTGSVKSMNDCDTYRGGGVHSPQSPNQISVGSVWGFS